MIKNVYYLEPAINYTEGDRFYFRFHTKEAMRFFGPWMRRYETYRSYDAPPEADRYNVRRYRLTEIWFNTVDDFLEANILRPWTAPSFGWPLWGGTKPNPLTLIPARPTENFLRKEPTPEQMPIIRWYRCFRYPKNVPVADGEKWYLEVHSQEAKKQKGLLYYASHRCIQPSPVPGNTWQRVDELWYQDFNAWRKAVIEEPPKYTKPPWGGEDPFVEMVSTFIPYKPEVDFLREYPVIP